MINQKRCIPCAGSGKMMGNGMLMTDCHQCNGKGKIDIVKNEIDYLLSKDTEHYKEAKDKIKALDDSMTDAEAEKILDEELKKTEPKQRGRPKKGDK
jgi:hypothetical protein